MKQTVYLILPLLFTLVLACNSSSTLKNKEDSKVEVKKNDKGQWRLLRNGKEFYIKGAGGKTHLEMIKAYGGNSIRIWDLGNAEVILDSAHKHGLTVMAGLWMKHERHGFDYDDSLAVKEQLAKFKERVSKLKNHPALLLWAVGNEVDLFYTNTKVWDAVNDVAKMIKEVDGRHPITTITAGLDAKEVKLIKEKAPAIDIYGINTYGGLSFIPEEIRAFGWSGPYLIGEWGPTGHWETDSTSWDVPIEETSKEKANIYLERYQSAIQRDSVQCIGSYVFYWGQKQETTPTWYGIFTEAGAITEVGDVLYAIWSNESMRDPGPSLDSVKLFNREARENIVLSKRQLTTAEVFYSKGNNPVKIEWEVLPESTDKKAGGDKENRPEQLKGLIKDNNKSLIDLTAPDSAGPYRLFVYVTDEHNKVATANIPFYVQ